MTTCRIEIDGNICEMPELAQGASGGGFAFGLYKAGSSLLYRTLRQLARNTSVGYFDVLHKFREAGAILETSRFSETGIALLRSYVDRRGIVFGGWREFPTNYELPLRADTHTYLLIRDPRDMITSHYFSLKYSHLTTGLEAKYILPERERLQHVDIDAFARSQASVVASYFSQYEALQGTRLLLRRYEDIILDRMTFANELCEHFGIDAPPAKRRAVVERNTVLPASEDVHAHVRQVTPGDHAKKLSPATIEFLNAELADVLRKYDYKSHIAG